MDSTSVASMALTTMTNLLGKVALMTAKLIIHFVIKIIP